jgi:hypothetical protein
MPELRFIVKPDDEDPEAAEVLVDGKIGPRSYRFLLDTGAARTRVELDDYTMRFPSSDLSSSSGVFATSNEDLIQVPSIELGAISRKDFTVARAAPGAVRSLIGMDLLKDLCCHFLFDQDRMLFDRNGARAGLELHELFLDSRHHPYVDVGLGSVTAKAVWDTGAGLTIVDSSLVLRHPGAFREEGGSTGTDSTGAAMSSRTFTMAETSIGGHAFPPHRVAELDLSHVNSNLEVPMDMILGYSTLRLANWLMDFRGRRWGISQPPQR